MARGLILYQCWMTSETQVKDGIRQGKVWIFFPPSKILFSFSFFNPLHHRHHHQPCIAKVSAVRGISVVEGKISQFVVTAVTTNTRPQRVFSLVQTCVLVDVNQPLPCNQILPAFFHFWQSFVILLQSFFFVFQLEKSGLIHIPKVRAMHKDEH